MIDALKDMTHGVTAGVSRRHLRHALIVGELALSIVLLTSALALARSALALQRLPRGLDTTGVMTAQLSLNDPRYDDRERLVRTARAIPSSRAFWIPRAVNSALTIVGVVRDIHEDGTPGANQPQVYLPYAQAPTVQLTVIARTAGGPAATAAAAIRDAVRRADPETPVSDEKTLDDVMAEPFVRPREVAWLIGAFAVLALVLSAVGVYGVMAYLATARAHEIRIRVALGATRADVMRLIVGRAVRLATIGVGIGVVSAPLALRLASGLLFGVSAFDPLTLVAVAAVLTLVSIAAAAIPANRAAREATGARGQI